MHRDRRWRRARCRDDVPRWLRPRRGNRRPRSPAPWHWRSRTPGRTAAAPPVGRPVPHRTGDRIWYCGNSRCRYVGAPSVSQPTSTARGCSASIQTQQEVGEADDRAAASVAGAPDGFRQRVVRAMRKGIAVDDEQGSFMAWRSSPAVLNSSFPISSFQSRHSRGSGNPGEKQHALAPLVPASRE